jgi:hypothetical protein
MPLYNVATLGAGLYNLGYVTSKGSKVGQSYP